MSMNRPLFYVGTDRLAHTDKLERCMISLNTLLRRRSDIDVKEWIMDSGAFTRVSKGWGHLPVKDYAAQIRRWSKCGRLVAAVAQDYMCEPFVLGITGRTVAEHQAMTIANYDALREQDTVGVYILPVLQGYQPLEYAAHLEAYGSRLAEGAWVGVGSVCKRNGTPEGVAAVLLAIKERRPDLRLHGFGLKRTTLESPLVASLIHSCDSMAWSYAARREGRDRHDWREAKRYCEKVDRIPIQGMLV